MRLTESIRCAFVRSVLSDVPQIDYDEQIRSVAMKAAVKKLPAKVRAVWDDPELQDYIETPHIRVGDNWIYLPLLSGQTLPDSVNAECARLQILEAEQASKMSELRRKIEGVASSVTTTQKLAILLPEFAKYLPKEEDKTAGLPAVTGVLEAFKAAGWPAGAVATA